MRLRSQRVFGSAQERCCCWMEELAQRLQQLEAQVGQQRAVIEHQQDQLMHQQTAIDADRAARTPVHPIAQEYRGNLVDLTYGRDEMVRKVQCLRGVDGETNNKGDNQRVEVRSRLVAREIKQKGTDSYFASTPPLALVRYVISRAVTLSKTGKRRQLMVLDAKRAFLHADALTETHVKPHTCETQNDAGC